MKKLNLASLRAWLDAEDGLLEREMIAAQQAEPAKEEPTDEAQAKARSSAEAQEAEQVARRVAAKNEERIPRRARGLYIALSILVCCGIACLMLYTVSTLPTFGDAGNPIHNEVSARYIERGLQETGAVNIVTGMILDYRAFDTLGESTVLFTAAMVVLLLLRMDKGSERYSQLARVVRRAPLADTAYEPKHDAILQASVRALFPVVMLLGIYVVLNGHISPGGGFSGGAIMGAGLVLYVIAFGFEETRRFFTYRTYQRTVLLALLTYAFSKCYSFYTGANGIESVIPLGTPGAILSSGLILGLNICVGLIVACTVYAFYAMFRKGEM